MIAEFIIPCLIVSVIGTMLLMFFTQFFKFKLTKRKVPIVISVYAIIVISLFGICYYDYKYFSFWVLLGCYVITVVLLTLLVRISESTRDFLLNSPKIVKCPHCGAWNEYEELKYLECRKYNGWRSEDRAIRDIYGNRVGSYEVRERCTSYRDVYILRCTKCGEEFEHTY